MLEEMASLIKQDMNPDTEEVSPTNSPAEEEERKLEDDSNDSDDDEDDNDRDVDWAEARRRKKSPFRGAATEPIHQKNALEEEIKHDNNDKQYFDHTLQTIQEAGSEAEGTFQNTNPGNGQGLPKEASVSEESEDRDDEMIGEDDQSTDASVNNQPAPNRNDFTFMGNEDTSVFEQISKFTSVEQYREFLEKELGDDKLMSAYPILKEFVILFSINSYQGDKLLFSEKTTELEALLAGILSK